MEPTEPKTKPVKVIIRKPRKRLTLKQNTFIHEYIRTKNATTAAIKAYNPKNRNTARVMAAENLAKPIIVNELAKVMKQARYDPVRSINLLQQNEEKGAGIKATASDSIRASELLLKLNNMLIDKSQSISISANIDNMDKTDLIKLKARYDKLLKT